MKIHQKDKDGVCVFELQGDLDFHSSPEFRDKLHVVTDKQVPKIMVTLKKVTYIDSSGLATFVEVGAGRREHEPPSETGAKGTRSPRHMNPAARVAPGKRWRQHVNNRRSIAKITTNYHRSDHMESLNYTPRFYRKRCYRTVAAW